ncbi:unnamed protein product [Closterium sp. NIES-54]
MHVCASAALLLLATVSPPLPLTHTVPHPSPLPSPAETSPVNDAVAVVRLNGSAAAVDAAGCGLSCSQRQRQRSSPKSVPCGCASTSGPSPLPRLSASPARISLSICLPLSPPLNFLPSSPSRPPLPSPLLTPPPIPQQPLWWRVPSTPSSTLGGVRRVSGGTTAASSLKAPPPLTAASVLSFPVKGRDVGLNTAIPSRSTPGGLAGDGGAGREAARSAGIWGYHQGEYRKGFGLRRYFPPSSALPHSISSHFPQLIIPCGFWFRTVVHLSPLTCFTSPPCLLRLSLQHQQPVRSCSRGACGQAKGWHSSQPEGEHAGCLLLHKVPVRPGGTQREVLGCGATIRESIGRGLAITGTSLLCSSSLPWTHTSLTSLFTAVSVYNRCSPLSPHLFPFSSMPPRLSLQHQQPSSCKQAKGWHSCQRESVRVLTAAQGKPPQLRQHQWSPPSPLLLLIMHPLPSFNPSPLHQSLITFPFAMAGGREGRGVNTATPPRPSPGGLAVTHGDGKEAARPRTKVGAPRESMGWAWPFKVRYLLPWPHLSPSGVHLLQLLPLLHSAFSFLFTRVFFCSLEPFSLCQLTRSSCPSSPALPLLPFLSCPFVPATRSLGIKRRLQQRKQSSRPAAAVAAAEAVGAAAVAAVRAGGIEGRLG